MLKYIKAINTVSAMPDNGNGYATVTTMAQHLNVVPATVYPMLKRHSARLNDLGLRRYSRDEARSLVKADESWYNNINKNGVQLLNKECIAYLIVKYATTHRNEYSKKIRDALQSAGLDLSMDGAKMCDKFEVATGAKALALKHDKFGNIRLIIRDKSVWFFLDDVKRFIYNDSIPTGITIMGSREYRTISAKNFNYARPVDTLGSMAQKYLKSFCYKVRNGEIDTEKCRDVSHFGGDCESAQNDHSNDSVTEATATTASAPVATEATVEPTAQSNETVPGSDLAIFKNDDFNIRCFDDNGVIYFVAADICNALGYTNSRDAIKNHVDSDDYSKMTVGNRTMGIINESGMYSLVLGSRIDGARKFKKWVTAEVLPSIRKNGAYMTEETLEKALMSPDFLIRLATKLKEEQTARLSLEEENKKLLAENKILSKRIVTWDYKEVFKSIVNTYAGVRHRGNIAYTYGVFYKNLNRKLGINVNMRKTGVGQAKIDTIKDSEWKSVISLATALCAEYNIDISDILRHAA